MQGKGGSTPPTHTAAAVSTHRDKGEASRLVPVTLNVCVSMNVHFCGRWGMTGTKPTSDNYTSAMSTTQTSITVVPKKVSEVDPSIGGTTLLSSASLY